MFDSELIIKHFHCTSEVDSIAIIPVVIAVHVAPLVSDVDAVNFATLLLGQRQKDYGSLLYDGVDDQSGEHHDED